MLAGLGPAGTTLPGALLLFEVIHRYFPGDLDRLRAVAGPAPMALASRWRLLVKSWVDHPTTIVNAVPAAPIAEVQRSEPPGPTQTSVGGAVTLSFVRRTLASAEAVKDDLEFFESVGSWLEEMGLPRSQRCEAPADLATEPTVADRLLDGPLIPLVVAAVVWLGNDSPLQAVEELGSAVGVRSDDVLQLPEYRERAESAIKALRGESPSGGRGRPRLPPAEDCRRAMAEGKRQRNPRGVHSSEFELALLREFQNQPEPLESFSGYVQLVLRKLGWENTPEEGEIGGEWVTEAHASQEAEAAGLAARFIPAITLPSRNALAAYWSRIRGNSWYAIATRVKSDTAFIRQEVLRVERYFGIEARRREERTGRSGE